MVFPYRTPAPIDPDPSAPVRPRTLDRWVRAVSGAAVIFLISASAMMFALMRDLVRSRQFRGNSAEDHLAQLGPRPAGNKPPPPPPPQCAAPPRREAPPPRVFLAPLGLASLGATTHDPTALLARAARLQKDGADLTLTRSLLPMSVDRALAEGFAPHARIGTRWDSNGIEVQSLPTGSIAALAGLQRGDVLTAINGYPFVTPETMIEAHRTLTATGVAVVEVLRGERRLVLEVHFTPEPPRPPTAIHGP
ncbi:MAG: PDZ domain-containing protein [Byssovorax sp.]